MAAKRKHRVFAPSQAAMPPTPATASTPFVTPLTLVILFLISLAILYRLIFLNRIPGINGDEAFELITLRTMLSGGSFTLMTPNGHYGGLLWVGLHSLVMLLMPDSLDTMRIPAALFSSIFILLNGWSFVRVLGRPRGLAMTLFLTSLPAAIAYSRICWEIVLIIPVSAFTLAMAVQGSWIASAVVILLGFFVHPTMIFIIPAVVPVLCWHLYANPSWTKSRKIKVLASSMVLGLIAVIIFIAFLPPEIIDGKAMLGRLSNLGEFGNFILLYLRLLSGISCLGDFVGLPDPAVIAAVDWLFGTLFFGILAAGLFLFIKRRRAVELALAIGLLLSLFGFYLTGGAMYLSPGVERYGLSLVAPSMLLFVYSLSEILAGTARKSLLLWLASAMAVFWLALFGCFYFGESLTSGGNAGKPYRTATVEPKTAMFHWIVDEWTARNQKQTAMGVHPNQELIIVAEEFWTYWPLRVLSLSRPDLPIHIVSLLDEVVTVDRLRELMKSGAYAEGFSDDFLYRLAHKDFVGNILVDHTVNDEGGRPIIYIWRLRYKDEVSG